MQLPTPIEREIQIQTKIIDLLNMLLYEQEKLEEKKRESLLPSTESGLNLLIIRSKTLLNSSKPKSKWRLLQAFLALTMLSAAWILLFDAFLS